MYKILEKKVWLSEEPAIKEFVLDAPEIAKAPQVVEMAAEWCAGLSDPSTKRPPTVKLEAPDRGEPGRKLDLSAIGSEDPDQYPLGFIWDFGDGSPQDFTPVARHAFAEPGRYTVTLKVTDGKRHTVHQSQVTIAGEAGDSPPTVTLLVVLNSPVSVVAVAVKSCQ